MRGHAARSPGRLSGTNSPTAGWVWPVERDHRPAVLTISARSMMAAAAICRNRPRTVDAGTPTGSATVRARDVPLEAPGFSTTSQYPWSEFVVVGSVGQLGPELDVGRFLVRVPRQVELVGQVIGKIVAVHDDVALADGEDRGGLGGGRGG